MSLTLKPKNTRLYEYHCPMKRWEEIKALFNQRDGVNLPCALLSESGELDEDTCIDTAREISHMAIVLSLLGNSEQDFKDFIELAGWLMLCNGCSVS